MTTTIFLHLLAQGLLISWLIVRSRRFSKSLKEVLAALEIQTQINNLQQEINDLIPHPVTETEPK